MKTVILPLPDGPLTVPVITAPASAFTDLTEGAPWKSTTSATAETPSPPADSQS